jgi:hypothetical protein
MEAIFKAGDTNREKYKICSEADAAVFMANVLCEVPIFSDSVLFTVTASEVRAAVSVDCSAVGRFETVLDADLK